MGGAGGYIADVLFLLGWGVSECIFVVRLEGWENRCRKGGRDKETERSVSRGKGSETKKEKIVKKKRNGIWSVLKPLSYSSYHILIYFLLRARVVDTHIGGGCYI